MSGKPVTPLLTVDAIIEVPGGIVLIERKNPPHGWALPGGFVDLGESLSHAVKREAMEETSLEIEVLEQFFSYSDPSRDPRGPTVSVVFVARSSGTPRAADDAKNLKIFRLEDLPPLAFDHALILADYKVWTETGRRPGPTR
jgi:ADP-ribose pyrophosphatase YjhB (NUDIX family)